MVAHKPRHGIYASPVAPDASVVVKIPRVEVFHKASCAALSLSLSLPVRGLVLPKCSFVFV